MAITKTAVFPTLNIDRLWNARRYPFFDFREQLNASQKNVILVAPTLGPRSDSTRLPYPNYFIS